MSDVKKISEWERQKGVIVKGAKNLDDLLTEEEFDAIDPADKQGVNHEDRVKFLEDNGYEVTRENMMNPDLSAKVRTEE